MWMKNTFITVFIAFFVPVLIQRTLYSFVCCLTAYVGSLSLLIFIFRTWYKWQTGKYSGNVQIVGKIVLVTGGTTGIGFETARELAKRKAEVVLITGRDPEKGNRAAAKIREQTNNPNVTFYQLELSSLTKVRQFVQNISNKYSKLDILINNAGGSEKTREITVDGFEKGMATNYFGPFLLTHLLLPLLKASPSARIINLSSMVYKFGILEVDNLDWNRNFQGFKSYSASKLAILLFTRSLATKLAIKKSTITVNAVHPGIVNTEIMRQISPVMRYIVIFFMSFIFKTSFEGAQTSLFCALEPDLAMVSGVYFEDCRANFELYPTGKDAKTAEMLWEISMKLCGIDDKLE